MKAEELLQCRGRDGMALILVASKPNRSRTTRSAGGSDDLNPKAALFEIDCCLAMRQQTAIQKIDKAILILSRKQAVCRSVAHLNFELQTTLEDPSFFAPPVWKV